MIGPMRLVAVSLALHLAASYSTTVAQDARPAPAPKGAPANDAPAIPTVSAEYVVRIVWEDEVRLPDMTNLILSRRETKDSARVCLNLEKPPQFSARADRRGPGTHDVTLSVAVNPRTLDVRLGAAEFLEEIVAALPNLLRGHQAARFDADVERARERLDRARAHQQAHREKVTALRAQLRKQTGRADPVENWPDAIAGLEQERQKLMLDATGHQARRRAIEETIAKITAGAERRAKDDEIARELEKIVALREEELHRAKQLVSTGRMSETEIANIGAKAAEARAKLLERREFSARAAGGELLVEFNRELLMLTINAAENQARLDLIRETLDRFHQSAGDVEGLKVAEQGLTFGEAAVRSAGEELSKVEDRYAKLAPPTISVIERDVQTLEQWTKENAQLR